MLVKLLPPSLLTCHWTVGAGLPLTVETKETELPPRQIVPSPLTVAVGAATTATVLLHVAVQVPSLIVSVSVKDPTVEVGCTLTDWLLVVPEVLALPEIDQL